MAENQCWRLLTASGEELLVHGYGRLTSRDISRRAGVSSATFYKHFDNVDACLLAAHGMVTDALWELMGAACAEAGPWPQRLGAALEAAVDYLLAEPSQARLLGADLAAGVPTVAAARERLLGRLAGLLCSGRAQRLETADCLGPEVEVHLTGGTAALIGERIVAGEIDKLPATNPELVELLSRPYRPRFSPD